MSGDNFTDLLTDFGQAILGNSRGATVGQEACIPSAPLPSATPFVMFYANLLASTV
jgi:hypothetical protein